MCSGVPSGCGERRERPLSVAGSVGKAIQSLNSVRVPVLRQLLPFPSVEAVGAALLRPLWEFEFKTVLNSRLDSDLLQMSPNKAFL